MKHANSRRETLTNMLPTVNVHRPITTINCPVCNGIVKPNIISEDMFDINPSAEIEVKCPHCKRRSSLFVNRQNNMVLLLAI